MSQFADAVLGIVRGIPVGTVTSYGMVALLVGVPRGGRQVGWVLRQNHDHLVPWWRVVNRSGRISIKANFEHDANEQRDRLRSEKVRVDEKYQIDMKKYGYVPDVERLKNGELSSDYLEMIGRKFRMGY